ncbi:Dabb family protein [Rubrobacter taiwanensis]|jgi:antibiotic biosynthesis monooxygenase (ABM) superfamily enzyme|uniref:Dabb family protein n=1 Tax=Rubrobacter taiwanensis TaxID=185139 RepID=A0A4R1BNQ3_9ACTN|nr:Dabb family protein [Rubrobacter taiwanensis]TCJ18905.1 Dabb family protein [Rubrobacter taiwanensis]
MVDHLVFFTVEPHASEEEVEDLLDSIRALKEKVPGVVDLTAGENFSPRSGGYTHGLFARFENRQALDNYMNHSEHLAVVEKLDRLTTGRIVVDYET